MSADFADRTDFENAERGLIARLEPGVVKNSDGRVVFDIDSYTAAVQGDCPDTVDPSLWRQSQLTAIQGLFEVTAGIYQVRGADLSNMTLVESDSGVIVIDPLISQECAAAALALYRAHRGEKPVTAIIYTHAHLDHFGGVLGVVDADTDVPIVAPVHFMEHAVSENVYAGTAMLRRGMYYAGDALPRNAEGTVGTGLGPGGSNGTVGLLAPTVDITQHRSGGNPGRRPDRVPVDPGHRVARGDELLLPRQTDPVPGRECHAQSAQPVDLARGAQVRDPRIWSRYIAEAIDMFGDDSDVAFASHHWPTWGTEEIRRFMTEQRDLYAYLHDQTLRLLNQGHSGYRDR